MTDFRSIVSGSSGNCALFSDGKTKILIDCGISGKKVTAYLNDMGIDPADLSGILVTHEHIDHIAGLGVLARRYEIPIFATEKTIQAILNSKSVGKIDEDLFQVVKPGKRFSIGELIINPISISHDAADPVAYKVINGDKSLAVVTDLGNYNQAIVDELQGLDALLLEANHDIKMLQMGAYPYPLKQRILGDRGHLSNERSGQLLCELLHDHFGTVLLGHLSKENNYEKLAYEAVRLEVTMGDNPYKADDFPMYVAKRDTVTDRIRV